jgi:hypothetical protein
MLSASTRKWFLQGSGILLAVGFALFVFPYLLEMVLVGDGKKTTNVVPSMGSVSQIVLTLRAPDSRNVSHLITDADAINKILAAYEAVKEGWHTQGGHFTTPVASNQAIFCSTSSEPHFVLWFDEHLLRSRHVVGDSSIDAYHDGDKPLLKAFIEASKNLSQIPNHSRCAA